MQYVNGVVGSAWQDLGGLKYRIGVSPTIPATGPDNTIPLPSGDGASEASIAGDSLSDANTDAGDTYVAWTQTSSTTSGYGFYSKDVAANGPIEKAPASGVNSLSKVVGWVRIPIATTPSGVFLAYPSNTSTPVLLLWKIGSKTATVVPGSTGTFGPQIVEGPSGRLWIAWSNSKYGIVVVRTNKADTRFGPVETYPTPCGFLPSTGLGGSATFGRLDIGIKCQDKENASAIFATQVLAPMSLSPASTVIKNTQQNAVVFHVSDAGDPVPGAKVTVDGKVGTTNSAGAATLTFAKGAKTGTFTVVASGSDYLPASGHLTIES
jgi:hypothetical protein